MQAKKALEEKDYLSLLLPEGMLAYFQVTEMKKQAGQFEIYLEEKNIPPTPFSKDKLTSKGFYEEVTVQDFPLRGKACFLKVKRRRWLNETTGQTISRDWDLVAKGTRMTGEFATFLKGIIR